MSESTSEAATAFELHHPPKRCVGLRAAVVVALVALAAGLFAGAEIRERRPAQQKQSSAPSNMAGMAEHAPPPGAGSQAVYISPARQQLIGVRSAPVGYQHVEGTIRTVGTLAYDETRTAQIHTRVSGWVEQLYVDYVGRAVRKGQPLFAVYSPDLATAQADYLVALKARRRLAENANPDIRAGADALLAAARERLMRWSVSDAQIAELERTERPSRTMSIESPFDGIVTAKAAFAGQYVTPEMTSFQLADLSTVWAVGQVFEYEAARLHVGDPIEVEFPYGQAPKLETKIDFIYPDVDPTTRRVRFRAVLPNPDRKLKPDTYVTLVWHGEAGHQLVVPREAVIDTGERKYVLLALPNGYFAPRDVQIGAPIGAFYTVISGLSVGERVVTSAQFLIDSETNLESAMQGMQMSMPGMETGKAPPAMGSAAPAGSAMPPMPGM